MLVFLSPKHKYSKFIKIKNTQKTKYYSVLYNLLHKILVVKAISSIQKINFRFISNEIRRIFNNKIYFFA